MKEGMMLQHTEKSQNAFIPHSLVHSCLSLTP